MLEYGWNDIENKVKYQIRKYEVKEVFEIIA